MEENITIEHQNTESQTTENAGQQNTTENVKSWAELAKRMKELDAEVKTLRDQLADRDRAITELIGGEQPAQGDQKFMKKIRGLTPSMKGD